jgi:hypothetical protein
MGQALIDIWQGLSDHSEHSDPERLCCCLLAGSLGPNTWVPWCYAMLAAIVIFAANGFYQHRSWWIKGGKETVFAEVDTITRLPSTSGASNTFGRSFQVRPWLLSPNAMRCFKEGACDAPVGRELWQEGRMQKSSSCQSPMWAVLVLPCSRCLVGWWLFAQHPT